MRVNRWQFRWQFIVARDFLHELVIFTMTFYRRFSNQAAPLDAEMVLRDRQRIFAAGLRNLHALYYFSVGDDEMRVLRSPQKISIEPDMLAGAGEAHTPIAKRNGDGVVDVSRRDEYGNDKLAKRRSRSFGRFRCPGSSRRRLCSRFSPYGDYCDFDQIAGLHRQGFGIARTYQGRIIPGQLGDWVRHLLQPRVIDVTAVVDRVIANEHDLGRLRSGCRCWVPEIVRDSTGRVPIETGRSISQLHMWRKSVPQEFRPRRRQ